MITILRIVPEGFARRFRTDCDRRGYPHLWADRGSKNLGRGARPDLLRFGLIPCICLRPTPKRKFAVFLPSESLRLLPDQCHRQRLLGVPCLPDRGNQRGYLTEIRPRPSPQCLTCPSEYQRHLAANELAHILCASFRYLSVGIARSSRSQVEIYLVEGGPGSPQGLKPSLFVESFRRD